MKKFYFALVLSCLGFAVNAQTVVFSQSFTGGVSPTTQCVAWETFRAQLLSTYLYDSFNFSGSVNPVGISCTNSATALAVANALRTAVSYSAVSGGQTWQVNAGCTAGGSCTSSPVEFGNAGSCSCATTGTSGGSAYDIRPAINNSNWGGIGSVTCGAASQTLTVTFYYHSPLPTCTSSVTGGTAVVTPTTGSSGTSFTLSLTGSTAATGLTYQWQSSSTGTTGSFSNITGATNATYTFTGLLANTYYQCIVTCSSAGGTGTSTVVEASYLACSTTATSWIGYAPSSTTFSYTGAVQTYTVPTGVTSIGFDVQGGSGGLPYTSGAPGTAANGGRVQGNLTVTPGQILYIYVGGKGADWTSSIASSGGFNGGGLGGSFAACGGGASDIRTSASGTAYTGRLVVAGGGGGGGDFLETGGNGGGLTGASGTGGACGGGQTGPACGTGYALGTLGAGGPGNTYSVGGGGGGYWGGNAGLSLDGGGGGGSSYTDPILASSVVHTQGYNLGNGIVTITSNTLSSYGINSLYVTPGTGAPLSDTGIATAANSATGYLSRTTTIAPITLYQGGVYASTVTWMMPLNYQEAQVWIDFNDDGTFTPAEEVTPVFAYSTTSTTSPTPFNISIPGTATLGNHLMRIRSVYELGSYGYALSSHIDPCLAQYLSTAPEYEAGDEVDYIVTIAIPPIPCSGTPVAGTSAVSPTTGNSSTLFTLSLTGSTFGLGLTYQWQSSPTGLTGSFTNIPGATSIPYSFTGLTASTYYQCVVTCTGFGSPATSTISEAIFISCTPTSASWSGGTVSGTTTYTYTGSPVLWTVPSGVTSISVDMQGAKGGNSSVGAQGGAGGRVQANLPVTAGTVIQINVGGAGANYAGSGIATGGITAGGTGGTFAGGGGGASDIRIGGIAFANRMIVAAGGGGAGYNCAATTEVGGYGGGLIGGVGYECGIASTSLCGSGGTQTAGGAGASSYASIPGTLGTGGNGIYAYSGGGGGGLYGGGGAAYGGGGGGSSYTDVSATSVVLTQNYNTSGNGVVIISYSGTTTDSPLYGINTFGVTPGTGTALADAGICAAASYATGYLSRISTIAPITLYQGGVHPSSVTWGNVVNYQEGQVWIDFNNDGVFSTSEEVSPVFGYNTVTTANPTYFNITIPTLAATGNHLMRIRGVYEWLSFGSGLSTDLDPCLIQYLSSVPKYADGDVVDYVVNIATPPACAGTPAIGTALVSPSIGNSSTPFILSLVGYTYASGLTYQWQSSTTGTTGSFTNIPGATNITYSFTGITSNMYYQCIVNCTFSGLSTTSTITEALLQACIPTSASWTGGTLSASTTYSYTGSAQTWTVPTGVTSITVDMQGGKGGNSSAGALGGAGGRTQATLAVVGGSVIQINVGGAGANFTGSGIPTGGATAGGSGGQFAGGGGGASDIRIGGVALSNRKIIAAGGGGAGYNCAATSEIGGFGGGLVGGVGYECGTASTFYTGSGGTQTAGGAGATGYASFPGTLGAGGNGLYVYSGGGGGGYYGGGGAAYGGGGGGSSYTDVAATSVTLTSGYNTAGNGSVTITYAGVTPDSTIYGINTFGVTPGTGSALADAGICSAANPVTGYLDRTSSIPPITLYQGLTHPSSVTWGNATAYQEAQVWIDFNNNGTFETSEEVTPVVGYSTTATASPTYFNITIPGTAPTGNHVMRIRGILENAAAGYSLSTDLDPCLIQYLLSTPKYADGDMVDYIINIATPPPCTGTPVVATATVSPIVGGSSTPFVLSLTGYTLTSGLTYQWQSSPIGSGTWSNIPGATNITYSFTGISANTYYQCVVTCTSSGLSSNSTITEALLSACTPSSAAWSGVTTGGTSTFNYTGSLQTYTIPTGVISITISASGAQGGSSSWYAGGHGANMSGTFAVTPGHVLDVMVGQQGLTGSGNAGGGGGGSFVWDVTAGNVLLVAAGGGGGGGYTSSSGVGLDAVTTNNGVSGAGGYNGAGVSGNGGTVPTSFAGYTSYASGGAGWLSNGNTGTVTGSCYSNGGATPLTGGAGGTVVGSTSVGGGGYGGGGAANARCGIIGGGGGGGYSGGGCGCDNGSLYQPGGGGGSYNIGTSQLNSVGHTGNGIVIITYTSASDAPAYGVKTFYVTPATGAPLSDTGMSAAANPTTGYLNRTSTILPVTLYEGGTYASSITWGITASYQEAQVWIDFNNDGVFSTTEEVSSVVGYSTTATPSPTSFNITIPSTAPLGNHILRIRGIWENASYGYALSSHLDPCLVQYLSTAPQYNDGDVVDYIANISTSTCTGTPTSGTVSATATVGCTTYTSTLSLTGATVAPGLTYQWQSSTDSISWSSITGDTLSTLSVTVTATIYYRCIITCTTSGLSATTPGKLLRLPILGAITPPGPDSVCAGSTITLGDTTTGVTWSSSSTAVATVGSTTGIVTGVTAGVFTITCGVYGCTTTKTLTVNAPPAAIAGTLTLCIGGSTTLTDATTGGTWTSGATTIATVDPALGIVSGISGGTAVITYTNVCGSATTTVTVAGTIASITGTTAICIGGITTLADVTTGGTWSSSLPGIATVIAGGIVTGVATGVTTIDYTTTCGSTSIAVTVNGTPASITGTATVCVGSITTLADATVGGTWSSTSTGIATVDGTGDVTGVAQGTSIISYTNGCGTSATITVTVNAAPATITGTAYVCVGSITTLADGSTGGTWTSGTTTIATVDATGDVTGVAGGTSIITYSNGCGADVYATVTVNAAPLSITGTATVCVGSITTLADATIGGTWSSSATGIATVDAFGDVTGVATGTAIISYNNTCGTPATVTVTVNGTPAAIAGTTSVCVGGVTLLTDATTGGTWSSANTTIATVDISGNVTGVAGGIDTIVYTTTCGSSFALVTVNTAPVAITGSTFSVCGGLTITLVDSTAGGTWTSSASGTASIDPSTGIVTGVLAGTVTITYTTTCGTSTATVYVNSASPASIAGIGTVCAGDSTTLTDATLGGTWTSSTTTVATVSLTGVVTGVGFGTTTISYATGCGSPSTYVVSVNIAPSVITGIASVCAGIGTSTLFDSVAGCTWTSSNTAIVTVDAFGVITGVTAGTATITCGNACGYSTITVNVNTGSPTAITGTTNVCDSAATTLTDGVSGGTWTSSNAGIASVGGATGTVTGMSAGVVTITYSTGCGSAATTTFTVNAIPTAITGTGVICAGNTLPLSETVTGGTWTSGATTIATVDVTGLVTGVATGFATITYTTGCGTVTTIVTVNGAPLSITGLTSMCVGSSTTLADATAGGTWSSSNTTVATIDSTGFVSGLSAGTTTITYSIACGIATVSVSVINAPAPITGSNTACTGSVVTLTDSTSGGTWSSSYSTVATIGTTGAVTGIALGTATITYTTGCGISILPITVNTSTSPIVGGTTPICTTATTTLSDVTPGGTWVSGSTGIATVDGFGVVTGVSAGVATISYSTITCTSVTVAITVNGAPTAITGATSVCVGAIASLADATTGGTWSSGNTGIATIDITGAVTGVSVGVVNITYTTTCGYTFTTINVNGAPSPIVGVNNVCSGSSIALSCTTTGGTWSSASPGVASVDISGNVSGLSVGVTNIYYTTACGVDTLSFIVKGIPASITGLDTVCTSSTILLSDATGFGVWSSGSTTVATVDSTGLVHGVVPGTATITYSTGCAPDATYVVNVLQSPTAIVASTTSICNSNTITLTDSISGGTWTSSNTAKATVTVGGVVAGVSAGTVIISYSNGCGSVTIPMTINPLPATITGVSTVCPYFSISLTETAGGTWSSSTTTIATVSGSGLVTGVSPGVDTIKYTLGTGCSSTKIITVYPFTNAGVITGLDSVCAGTTITLVDTNFGGAGTWASSATGTATVSGGVVTGITGGTVNISYSGTYGCSTGTVHKTITVKPQPNAGTITGASSMCMGTPLSLTDSGVVGGTWSSSSTATATVTGTGVVTAVSVGIDTIKYTAVNGCGTRVATHVVNVIGVPATITGVPAVCAGGTDTLFNATTGGTWTSSDLGTDTIVGGGFGVIYGVSAGVSTISYSTGCGSAATITFTVNPLPDAGTISGIDSMCAGSSVTLTETSTTGAWSVSNGNAVIVGGVVTGISAGLDTVLYNASNVCGFAIAQMAIYVNPLPVAGTLTGPDSVCFGASITLTPSSMGGTWSAANGNATVVGGLVTGMVAGTDSIFYTATTVCGSATVGIGMVITPLPVAGTISGILHVCLGSTTSLTDGAVGGVWTSSNSSIATVAGGVVSGLVAGTDTIIYTVTTSCGTALAQQIVTVNPLPTAGTIAGSDSVCTSGTSTLTDAIAGGTWSIANAMATISTGGIVSGVSTGIDTVVYTVTSLYCGSAVTSKTVFVQPIPNAGVITGANIICAGSTVSLTDSVAGGVYTSGNIVTSILGNAIHGNMIGLDTVTYTIYTTCGNASTTFDVQVDSALSPIITGGSYVCIGGRKIDTLSGTPAGGTWSMSNTKAFMIGNVVFADTSIATAVSGLDTAIYTVSNGCGSFIGTESITVNSKGHCDTVSSVNTVNNNDGTIKVYPNPSAGAFTVELPELGANTSITVMDIYGKIIELREIKNSNTTKFEFNFYNLASGTYMIKVISNDNIYNGKVLIMNR